MTIETRAAGTPIALRDAQKERGHGGRVQQQMSNIVSLQAVRELKSAENGDHEYRARILGMDKLELLEEMVRFQEERSRVGYLTLTMMIRGKILFKALEESAETQELRLLTKSYRRHLEFEMAEHLKKSGG